MLKDEKKRIQAAVLKLANRVEKDGRENERVHVKMNMRLIGNAAINYKVLKLFAPGTSDAELVELLFRSGVQTGAELLRISAAKHGIKI